jgi:hypothetical protein
VTLDDDDDDDDDNDNNNNNNQYTHRKLSICRDSNSHGGEFEDDSFLRCSAL